MDKKILEREKFIWLDIIRSAERILPNVKSIWKKDRKIPHVVYSWPSESLTAKDGTLITHMVTFMVPNGMSSHEAVLTCTKHTKPYALLVIEQNEQNVTVTLESFHGTRCWKFPITRHGDVEVLEKEIASEDTESFGILWRRSVGQG